MFPRLLPAKRTVTSPASEDIIMTIIIGSFCTVETLHIKINNKSNTIEAKSLLKIKGCSKHMTEQNSNM